MCCYNTDGADDGVMTHGPIIEAEGSVRTDPYSLPEGFRWDNLELSSQTVVRFCLYRHRNCIYQVRWDWAKVCWRQTEQCFSVAAEGALHSAKWELLGGGRQHRQVRLLSGVPAMVRFRRVHLLRLDFECKWVSLFVPCYCSCGEGPHVCPEHLTEPAGGKTLSELRFMTFLCWQSAYLIHASSPLSALLT